MRLVVCLSLSEQQNSVQSNMSTKPVSHNFGYFHFNLLWCHVCVVIVWITVMGFRKKIVFLRLDSILLPFFISALKHIGMRYIYII